MELIPAIDLLGGKVVRLAQGDFERVTAYGTDPVAVARRWVGEGATRLHIVDLDGARAGRPVQAALVASIVQAAGVSCQVAGGLRSGADVRAALGSGADRVVLGTALLKGPAFASELLEEHGAASIVAAIDVRGGLAMGEGWVGAAGSVDGVDAVRTLRAAGVEWFAVTAIERDGLLGGPDLDLLYAVAAAVPGAGIIASAGVASLEDIRELSGRGFAGAILGRALYEGTIDLRRALRASVTVSRGATGRSAAARGSRASATARRSGTPRA
jgi:phosphoribosylformimino-5-aminoimidazole carboxamide ribotide isomerase